MQKKIIALGLLAMSGAAHAGGYLGFGLGQSSTEVTPYYYAPAGTTVSVSDTDDAFKFFGGYGFNENVALEAGYTRFGEFTVDYADSWGPLLNETREISAFYVAAVGTIPLGAVSLFGKAGLANWWADYSESNLWTWSDSATGIDPVVGLGVKIDLGDTFALRGEFERYMDVGDADLADRSDIDVLSINAVLKF
jgi:OOP family OmpA-OmpF porin